MRRNIPTIFVIFLLGMLVLCSACAGPGNESPQQNVSSVRPQQNGGLVQVTVPSASSRIVFDTALQRLKDQTSAGSEKLFYILAKDVDDQGNATSWLFGVSNGSRSRLLIFDRAGRTEMPLSNSSLPSEEIDLDRVVPIHKVFSDNRGAILGIPVPSVHELRELELKEGIYTLTITSAKTVRVIKFDAAAETLIYQNSCDIGSADCRI